MQHCTLAFVVCRDSNSVFNLLRCVRTAFDKKSKVYTIQGHFLSMVHIFNGSFGMVVDKRTSRGTIYICVKSVGLYIIALIWLVWLGSG